MADNPKVDNEVNPRAGCECESRRKPCSYHEGYEDALDLFDQIGLLAPDGSGFTLLRAGYQEQLQRDGWKPVYVRR